MAPEEEVRAVPARWRRPHPRLLLVKLASLAGPTVVALVALVIGGRGAPGRFTTAMTGILITAVVIGVLAGAQLRTTRFRLTEGEVELRSGVLFRRSRTLSLERVSGVDITADLSHRLAGLSTVRIGTDGMGNAGTGLTLDGLVLPDAEELRRRLVTASGATTSDETVLSELDPRWYRLAPLTVWGVGGVLIALGIANRALNTVGLTATDVPGVRSVAGWFGSMPLGRALATGLVILVILGVVGSVAWYVETWHGYRLARPGPDTLRVRRGLLLRRSVTMRPSRIRGVELREPVPLRWAGGASLAAITSGLGDAKESRRRRQLIPPAPRAEVLRVAARVLGQDLDPAGITWARAPRAALGGRVARAVLVTALPSVLLVVLGGWVPGVSRWAGVVLFAVTAPLGLLAARSAQRARGHALHRGYLVTRAGWFVRRTVAIHQDDVVGWRISRWAFSRQVTLGATTASGRGVYQVGGVSEPDAVRLAEAVVPGLLTPLLDRGGHPAPVPRSPAGRGGPHGAPGPEPPVPSGG